MRIRSGLLVGLLVTLLFMSGAPGRVERAAAVTLSAFSCEQVSAIPPSECRALVALYEATQGPQWRYRQGWLEDPSPCSWQNVICSEGHVTALLLTGNRLRGALPAAIGDLTHLRWLFLASNELTGALPATLENLVDLRRLYVGSNQLDGPLLAELGALVNLEELSLNNNQLSGAIPSSWGNLSNLQLLDLEGNQVSGALPPSLGNLGQLHTLNLSHNLLEGAIPAELGALANLELLNLRGNRLNGAIPETLNSLASLQILRLGDNLLEGAIPIALADLDGLVWLELGPNQLEGQIPAEVGSLPMLERLDLQGNRLSGPLPADLGDLAMLRRLDLQDNQLTGSIPARLGDLTHLSSLRLDSNRLEGAIPSELGQLTQLTTLNLANNALAGAIPESLVDLAQLRPYPDTNLSYNMLLSDDATVVAFVAARDPTWAETQTIAPRGLHITQVTSATLTLAWTPISYTAHSGYYQVGVSTEPGGPYEVRAQTENKEASSAVVGDLNPGSRYYLSLRSITLPHDEQANMLISDYADEISHTLPLDDPILGLSVLSDSPTLLGRPTRIEARVQQGNSITYTWALGDGARASGAVVTHTYPTVGSYCVEVTATNRAGAVTATTMITILDRYPDIYLPLVLRGKETGQGG